MRYLMIFTFLSFTAFCIIIAISNRQLVTFDLHPIAFKKELPLFLLIFGGVFAGLFAGWLASLLKSLSYAREKRLSEKHIKELEKELNERNKLIMNNE